MIDSTEEPVRVLQVLPFNKKGGLPLRTYRVSKRLNENPETENIIVVPDTSGAFFDRVIEDSSVEIHKLKFKTPTYFDAQGAIQQNAIWAIDFIPSILRFKRFIEQNSIDVVHVNEIFMIQAGIGAYLGGSSVAWHLISDQFPSWLVRGLMPIVDKIADVKMVVTEGNLDYYFDSPSAIENRDDVMLVPGVANTDQFVPGTISDHKSEELREEFGIGDEFVITTVANLNPTKGIEYTLRAIDGASFDFKYLVVGEKDDREYVNKLLQITKEEQISKDVIFTGYREDVKEILSITDVFVLPSLGEGTPLSLMEAMAMEVPIVATDVGGVKNMLADGDAGIVVPPRSEADIREAITGYVSNPEMMERTAKVGRRVAINRFSTQQLTQRYREAYEQSLEN